MSAFPTLSQYPSFPLGEEREDSTLRSKFEDGYEQTRPKFTKIRYTWSLTYNNLTNTDKATLEAFVTTVREGADSFTWTNPVDSASYTVKFAQIPKYECTNKIVSISYFDCSFTLRTV
jgi:phage-related protein